MLLGNLRSAVDILQGQTVQSRLRTKLLAWREWVARRRHLAKSVASRLQGRYLGGVWQTWREFVQFTKLSRSQGMAAMGHFTARTIQQVRQGVENAVCCRETPKGGCCFLPPLSLREEDCRCMSARAVMSQPLLTPEQMSKEGGGKNSGKLCSSQLPVLKT